MHLNTIHDNNGVYCQNCGWGSHCGNARRADVKDNYSDAEPYSIKICEICRCKQCTPPDQPKPKTYNLKFKKIKTEVFKEPKREVTWEQLLQHMQSLSKK